MGFKIGDRVSRRKHDDSADLRDGVVYVVTDIKFFRGDRFISTNLTGESRFFERRFIHAKPAFKGNK